MILSFKKQFLDRLVQGCKGDSRLRLKQDCTADAKGVPPKIHTIREDKGNRWRAGKKIHAWIGSPRNPDCNPYCFAEGYTDGVETIRISYHRRQELRRLSVYQQGVVYAHSFCNEDLTTWVTIEVNNQLLSKSNIRLLAINDGFEDERDFFYWFSKDFTGKIIHWTNLRYEDKHLSATMSSLQLAEA